MTDLHRRLLDEMGQGRCDGCTPPPPLPSAADVKLVRDTIIHHRTEALRLTHAIGVVSRRTGWTGATGTLEWVTAQWHAFRATMLEGLPVDLAAQAVRDQMIKGLTGTGDLST